MIAYSATATGTTPAEVGSSIFSATDGATKTYDIESYYIDDYVTILHIATTADQTDGCDSQCYKEALITPQHWRWRNRTVQWLRVADSVGLKRLKAATQVEKWQDNTKIMPAKHRRMLRCDRKGIGLRMGVLK